jgi:SAM-dependent methyltransferase
LQQTRVFDLPRYRHLDEARITFLRPVLDKLKREMQLRTALDVGCGLGTFAVVLKDLGFQVLAVDGRQENIEEAQRRHQGIDFKMGDVEDSMTANLGSFDLVLCLGLLYHLESPLRAIRNLQHATGTAMLIESMCIDEAKPTMLLREEGPSEDQGLRHIAFYPSEACLAKMLYVAGFSFVYRFIQLPDHPHFQASSRRVRTLLAASKTSLPLSQNQLQLLPNPIEQIDPWATPWARFRGQLIVRTQPLRRRLGLTGQNLRRLGRRCM